ncbi:MAG TPA: CorA family divalent cation transporter, partial [Pyrinomonadaceae bacterium]|nr:CorA family divalent cation transporter [Pyrinomonadaceae bacterium]
MIETICLNSQSREFVTDFPSADISELCSTDRNVVWADVTDPTGEDFEQLAEEFGFHPLSIEDCRNAHQRPKVEEYAGYYFIVVYESELVGPRDDL